MGVHDQREKSVWRGKVDSRVDKDGLRRIDDQGWPIDSIADFERSKFVYGHIHPRTLAGSRRRDENRLPAIDPVRGYLSRLEPLEFGKHRFAQVVKGLADSLDFDVVDDDRGLQRKPELLLVCLSEFVSKLLVIVARDEERRVGAFETHVQHPVQANFVGRKALSFKLLGDDCPETIQRFRKSANSGRLVRRRAGFLDLVHPAATTRVQYVHSMFWWQTICGHLPFCQVETISRENGRVLVHEDTLDSQDLGDLTCVLTTGSTEGG
jgi:hypothetical protein